MLPLTIAILVACLLLFDQLLRHYAISESSLNGGAVLIAKLLLIVAILLFLDRVLVGLLHLHAERSSTLLSSRGVLVGITRGVVLSVGLLMVMDRPVRVGDYIELESGEQGFVEKIGWRSTWIRVLPNNTIIMPNSALSQSKIINYFYPSKELSVPVEVGVHYSSDLEHVERVTQEGIVIPFPIRALNTTQELVAAHHQDLVATPGTDKL